VPRKVLEAAAGGTYPVHRIEFLQGSLANRGGNRGSDLFRTFRQTLKEGTAQQGVTIALRPLRQGEYACEK
jgi:hypothetical protein